MTGSVAADAAADPIVLLVTAAVLWVLVFVVWRRAARR